MFAFVVRSIYMIQNNTASYWSGDFVAEIAFGILSESSRTAEVNYRISGFMLNVSYSSFLNGFCIWFPYYELLDEINFIRIPTDVCKL